MELLEYIPELIIGGVLAAFAWAFTAWSNTIKETSTRIIAKLDRLAKDFTEHRVNNAERIVRIERDIHHITERLDNDKAG